MGVEAEGRPGWCLPTQKQWLSPGGWVIDNPFYTFLCHFFISSTVFPKMEKAIKNISFYAFNQPTSPRWSREGGWVRNSWARCRKSCWGISQLWGKPSTGQARGARPGAWLDCQDVPVDTTSWHKITAGNMVWGGACQEAWEQRSEARESGQKPE